jgi:hypothetical protein
VICHYRKHGVPGGVRLHPFGGFRVSAQHQHSGSVYSRSVCRRFSGVLFVVYVRTDCQAGLYTVYSHDSGNSLILGKESFFSRMKEIFPVDEGVSRTDYQRSDSRFFVSTVNGRSGDDCYTVLFGKFIKPG